MKVKSKYILFLSLFILAISCSESTAPLNYKRSQKDEIMPLAVGNYWKYKTISPESLRNGDVYTLKVDREFINDGKTLFELSQSNIYYVGFVSDIRVNTVTGLETNHYLFEGNKEFELLYKYPAKLGDIYPKPINDSIPFYEVLTTSKIITTPAGTFPCYAYRYTNRRYNIDIKGDTIGYYISEYLDYCAVGVGMVKSVKSYRDYDIKGKLIDEDITTEELIDYSVK